MKAVILLSGGVDSSLLVAMALKQRYSPIALSFDYGQRHVVELKSAAAIAKHYQIPHTIIKIDPSSFAATPLTNGSAGPKERSPEEILAEKLSPYYVPARNTLFLAHAQAFAEAHNAYEIWFGPNADDGSFPDCSPNFVAAFQQTINLSAAANPPKIITPLAELSKSDIFALAKELCIPIEKTLSCYSPINDKPCLACDACVLRTQNNRVKC